MTNCILLYGNNTHPGSKYAGTFRIATELRKNGFTVSCIDLTAFKGFDDELKNLLSTLIGKETLWVGFSTTFLPDLFGLPILKQFESYSRRWKEADIYRSLADFRNFVNLLNPNTKLIAGGARYFPVEKLGFQVFKSYSDKTIIEYTNWCKGLLSNDKYMLPVIQGSEFQNFTTSQIIYHDSDIIKSTDTLPIEVSRGCIFKCKFCTYNLKGKKKGEWVKHAAVLKDEFVRNYENFGVTNYVFADDTYNDSLDKIKLLYDEVYSKLNFQLEFTTYLRLDLMMRNPDSAAILRDSGLKSAMFGIETLNPLSAKAIGKGVNPLEQFDFVRQLKENEFADVLLQSGIIAGLPHDTEETLIETADFLFSDKNKLDYVLVNPLGIHPVNTNEQVIEHSEFDLEYAKFGYDIIIDYNADFNNEVKWRNLNTGLTKDWCSSFASKVNDRVHKSGKFKFGAFLYAQYKSLGIPGHELRTMSTVEISKKYNIQELGKIRLDEYKLSLLKYYNLDIDEQVK
jgi:Radical SAM superfamily